MKGTVTEEALRNAVDKVQRRHTLLSVRIEINENQTPMFTSEDVGKIPVETISRISDQTWIEVYDKACLQPFDFYKEPAIRFYLIQSEEISDIMIFCHHVICDGISLAYLARDIMEHLSNSELETETLRNPSPINRKLIPIEYKLNPIVNWFLKRINEKWAKEKVTFDQEDYLNLHEAYWKNFTHRTLSLELTETQTERLVLMCKNEEVTVNSALAIAFIAAQNIILGQQPFLSKTGVGVSLRKYLSPPIDEEIGFFAGVATTDYKYKLNKRFWDNARMFHKKITEQYSTKKLLNDPLTFSSIAPSILEARNFKILGELVQPHQSRFEKLSAFSKREDTVYSILKRANTESVEKTIMGTALTNLTRMNFAKKYGKLELDRMIVHPGGGFPLSTVNIVIAAVTCVNKLSLIIEWAEERISEELVQEISQLAIKLLLGEFTEVITNSKMKN